MPHQDRLNIAVFIDFDNIEIGVKTTLNEHFDVGTILDAIKERGEVVTKIAYADWTRAGEYSRALTQHAIRLVQRNLTPGGDKNGADINLALDALEMAFTHPHINAYVIVGGDSDFLSLVEKLKQYDKKVFVVGGRAFTSVILQRNCHEFIAYENLAGARKPASRGGRPAPAAAPSPIAQAVPIVRRALKLLADREVSPQTGLLKSTLLQLDSTFSERNYGASSFLDFVEKLAEFGVVRLKHTGRSVIAELNEGYAEDGERKVAAEPHVEPDTGMPAGQPLPAEEPHKPAPAPQAAAPVATESAAQGVRTVARILGSASNLRWPMYVRNVKQALRAGEPGFDERRYGFTGLLDLLRACQRDGIVRLERDRRGGLRVFPGSSLQQRVAAPEPQPQPAVHMPEAAPGESLHAAEPAEPEPLPAPEVAAAERVEATAAADSDATSQAAVPAPKRKRSRTARHTTPPRAPRKTGARKAGSGRRASSRNRSAAAIDTQDGE